MNAKRKPAQPPTSTTLTKMSPSSRAATPRPTRSPGGRKSPSMRSSTATQTQTRSDPSERTRSFPLRSAPAHTQAHTERSVGTPRTLRSSARASSVGSESDEVRRLRGQLQGMKEQVSFMHKVVQDLSDSERERHRESRSSGTSKRASFARARSAVDAENIPHVDVSISETWLTAAALSHAASGGGSTEVQDVVGRHNDSNQLDLELASRLSDGDGESKNAEAESTLAQKENATAIQEEQHDALVQELRAKLAILNCENVELHSRVEEIEDENLRLHGTVAQLSNRTSPSLGARSSDTHGALALGDLDDMLAIQHLGGVAVDTHERCEAKIHELWQTIKTLKSFVETSRVEIEDLRVQRDNAVQSARRAREQNAKLAGNNNPQQKIRYLETLKNENAELIEKVRVLQSKLTRRKIKGLGHDAHSSASSEVLDEYPSSGDEPSDDSSDEERTTLLKTMWARNKKLEEEIDRLCEEKQALFTRQSRPLTGEARKSLTKSGEVTRWK